jgi:hypothetical protein
LIADYADFLYDFYEARFFIAGFLWAAFRAKAPKEFSEKDPIPALKSGTIQKTIRKQNTGFQAS